MDWVEEAPERELPERDEDRELGFTSLALGASASSLWLKKTHIHTANNDDKGLSILFQLHLEEIDNRGEEPTHTNTHNEPQNSTTQCHSLTLF